MSAPPTGRISTWPAIAQYLSERAPVSVSVDSAMRWSRRSTDPLPIRRWGSRDRPRVYALVNELDAWLVRQHHDAGEGK
jgi:hypothetical protein